MSPPLTIDQLILKGTHNSYSCRGNAPPRMNHPPDKQIDDFGVWHLELDFSVEYERGGPVAVVGHDRPQHAACWGYYLTDYLRMIQGTRSLRYRPVFVCFDVKRWKRSCLRFWRRPADWGASDEEKWDCGLAALQEACGDRVLNLEDLLKSRDYAWPTVNELAGRIVFYEPNKRTPDGRLVGLRSTHADHCVTSRLVEEAVANGTPLERNETRRSDGYRAIRLDQYQADWTFDYGVPPNPIVVDPLAAASTVIDDAEGQRWRCGREVSHGERVSEQGTFRFPFRTLEKAVERARGITPVTGGEADPRRAGHGWTVLLRSGVEVRPDIVQDVSLNFVRDYDTANG